MTKHVAKQTDNSFVILLISEVQKKKCIEEHTVLLHRQSVLNVAQNKAILL